MNRRAYGLAAAVGAVGCWASVSAGQAKPDIRLNAIGLPSQVGQRPAEAGDPALRVAGNAVDNRIVGLTFGTELKNQGTVPFAWAFPVYEMGPGTAADGSDSISTNKWIQRLGRFTSAYSDADHAHTHPFVPDGPGGQQPDHQAVAGEAGGHPHITFYVFRKPAPQLNDPPFTTTIIGRSDLKHTYVFAPNTIEFPAGMGLHRADPGLTDTYSASANQDQNFLGPISEMSTANNATRFMVANHNHMGGAYTDPALNQASVGAPFLHRDHGKLNKYGTGGPGGAMTLMASGAGTNTSTDKSRDHTAATAAAGRAGNIDHLLQLADADLSPANNAGARYFLGAAAFVAGEADSTLSDNFMWREITPERFKGVEGVGLGLERSDLLTDLPTYMFAFVGAPGVGSNTVPMFNPMTDVLLNLVPAPGAGAVLALTGLCLLGRRRR